MKFPKEGQSEKTRIKLIFKANRRLHIFLFKCIILTGFLFLLCFEVEMPQSLYGFDAALLDKTKRAGE